MNRNVVLICIAMLAGLGQVRAHPHNITTATAYWIEENRSFEVAMKLPVEEMEDILIRETGRTTLMIDGKQAEGEQLLRDYLEAHFRFKNAEGKFQPWRWIGYEVENETEAWVYLEVPVKTAPKGWTLHHTVMTDAREQQLNLILFKAEGRSRSLKFDNRRRELRLPLW